MPHTRPDGFLSSPPSGEGNGVLVLHAWWGLNDTIRAFCERSAKAGFVAFAPDLYHGKVADTVAGAEDLSSVLFADPAQALADVADATAFLHKRVGEPEQGLAVIGISLGAFFALDLSVSTPEQIRAVVVFYGTRPGDYSGSQAAYLGHFAETDEFEPQSEVDNLEAALKELVPVCIVERGPGEIHRHGHRPTTRWSVDLAGVE